MHPMLRISIYAIQASKLSRGCPRLPFWQGPMRSQQPSRTVVDRLVDEIPLRVEGRSCDEHLFRTESDPERNSVSSSPTEELAPVAPTGADDGPWNSQTNSAIISQPIICIRWMYRPAPAKPPKVVNIIQ